MTSFERRPPRTATGKSAGQPPVFLGKIKGEDYVAALRDPAVRSVLERVMASAKIARGTKIVRGV